MESKRNITRRDFMNGVAISTAAIALPSFGLAGCAPSRIQSSEGQYYPPALTGMRGSHEGSYEVAHSLALEGKTWPRPARQTDETYDLVVVGAGISGLSAAKLFRDKVGKDAKILVLDNHDDFGGHAKRNEFEVDGHKLIGYGGSQSIDEPAGWSDEALQLLKDLGINLDAFYTHFDREFTKRHDLGRAIYFNKKQYGDDVTVEDPFANFFSRSERKTGADAVRKFPVSIEAQDALIRLAEADIEYLTKLSKAEQIKTLRSMSYTDFLENHANVPKEGRDIMRDKVKSLWAVGFDALSALEAYRLEMPGMWGFDFDDLDIGDEYSDEPYIFHFPDGNASIPRALVSALLPDALPSSNMQDLVTAPMHYERLDQEKANTRIRLNSTVVKVEHVDDKTSVDVTYVEDGSAYRVNGKHVIMACYNRFIPFLCPELPDAQREAIEYAEKVPLAYINVALRNWRAFKNLGINSVYIPNSEMIHSYTLDFPVSMGSYKFTEDPDTPVIVHATYAPTAPDQGLSSREQSVVGRQHLYQKSFQDFEDDIFEQMNGALKDGGFDGDKDIAAITVNRWPHGYAYEYNELYDPHDWTPKNGPHIAGREQIGRISIANSDASAYSYVNGAIDAAVRAVKEQIG